MRGPKQKPSTVELERLLVRASRRAQQAVNAVLGFDEEHGSYATVVVRDYRLHEPFPFEPLTNHSPLRTEDREMTEERYCGVIRTAACNLSVAVTQHQQVNDDFARWLERRGKRNSCLAAFTAEFDVPTTTADSLRPEEATTRLLDVSFEHWDGRQSFDPRNWAKTARQALRDFLQKNPRRVKRIVLAWRNGLRVHAVYKRELPEITEAISRRTGWITHWVEELEPEKLSARKFCSVFCPLSKTEFVRRSKRAIRRCRTEIKKLEALAKRTRMTARDKPHR